MGLSNRTLRGGKVGSDNSVCWSSSHIRASFERAFLTGMQIPRADVRKKRHGKNGAATDVPSRTACICSQLGDCGVFGWREDEDERVRHLGGEFKATYVSGLAHPHTLSPFEQAKRGGGPAKSWYADDTQEDRALSIEDIDPDSVVERDSGPTRPTRGSEIGS